MKVKIWNEGSLDWYKSQPNSNLLDHFAVSPQITQEDFLKFGMYTMKNTVYYHNRILFSEIVCARKRVYLPILKRDTTTRKENAYRCS